MNRLWRKIEAHRDDCLFIYITHDVNFAASHNHAEKIWCKNYGGNQWNWEKIENNDMPEELLLNLLGNRMPVIFVEGSSTSYDTQLYRAIYEKYLIVPCGSCSSVIERTKSFRTISQLSHTVAFGIIDRDYRNDAEIDSLASNGVHTLNVAEVENLFVVEEVLRVIAKNQNFSENEINAKIEEVKNFIINERFKNQLLKQILKSTITEIKHSLSILDFSGIENEGINSCTNILKGINYESIFESKKCYYNTVANRGEYAEILSVYNDKSLINNIGKFFGLANKDYCNLVLRLLQGDKKSEIITALTSHLPRAIQFE